MKFYVWTGAEVEYYSGFLGVLASSKEEAINVILKKYNNDKYVKITLGREPDVYEAGEVLFMEED